MATICVIGTGYVGLVTGTCLADMGNYVTCVDLLEEKIKLLKQGTLPICAMSRARHAASPRSSTTMPSLSTRAPLPTGSGAVVTRIIRSNLARPGVSFAVASNPEFLREGSAVRDFQNPDRVVL